MDPLFKCVTFRMQDFGMIVCLPLPIISADIPSRIQLDQVYAYLEENGDRYEKLCKDHPDFTFMFEWISIKDMHNRAL